MNVSDELKSAWEGIYWKQHTVFVWKPFQVSVPMQVGSACSCGVLGEVAGPDWILYVIKLLCDFVASVTKWMSMNDTDRGKQKYLEKNLS